MMRPFTAAFVAAVALTVLAFVGVVAVDERTLGGRFFDAALAPGFAWPTAYWGSAHDPLQFLIALLLNVAFYTAVFAAVGASIRAWISPK